MFTALDLGYQAPAWEMPANVEKVELDAISGQRSHDNFPSKWDYIIKGTLSNELDPIHRLVKVCKGDEGKLATEAKIAVGDYTTKEFITLKENDPWSEDGKNRWQEGIDVWLAGQTDSRYGNPTEYCGETSEVSVNLDMPKNEENFGTEDITFKIKAGSDAGIAKLELYAKKNGEDWKVVKSFDNQREVEGTIKLERGKYELYAKAYSRSGGTKESNRVKIGTGGMNWNFEPTPTPTPTPTSTPTPTPTITVSPSVVPSITPP